MELTTTLHMTDKEFFDIICKSVQNDLGNSCIIEKGISYEKSLQTSMSGQATVKVSILDYTPYSLYSASFENSRSKTVMTYRIETSDENTITLYYKETAEFNNTIDNWNHKIVTFLYQKTKTKQMLQRLKAIEQSVITH